MLVSGPAVRTKRVDVTAESETPWSLRTQLRVHVSSASLVLDASETVQVCFTLVVRHLSLQKMQLELLMHVHCWPGDACWHGGAELYNKALPQDHASWHWGGRHGHHCTWGQSRSHWRCSAPKQEYCGPAR